MKILDNNINLKENLKKSLNKFWILWVILIVTVIFDFITTLGFMYQDGISQEKNMVVRWLATNVGIEFGVAIGKSLQILSVIVFSALSFKLSRAILLLIILLNILAIINNLL